MMSCVLPHSHSATKEAKWVSFGPPFRQVNERVKELQVLLSLSLSLLFYSFEWPQSFAQWTTTTDGVHGQLDRVEWVGLVHCKRIAARKEREMESGRTGLFRTNLLPEMLPLCQRRYENKFADSTVWSISLESAILAEHCAFLAQKHNFARNSNMFFLSQKDLDINVPPWNVKMVHSPHCPAQNTHLGPCIYDVCKMFGFLPPLL